MRFPSLQTLNEIRKKGLRPEVVGCFVYRGKILFVYSKEFDLWQLPQGGVNNQETIQAAILREAGEEMGEKFVENLWRRVMLIGTYRLSFPKKTQGSRELKTDWGEDIELRGKYYYFAMLNAKENALTIADTDFDAYQWASYEEAQQLAHTIYQRGKKRLTLKILAILKKKNII